ncbi:MAG: hypothetical protein HY042_12395, partial [Spirochaetia bacterium]|nr:hypothetical protein [Spirochaetia bacterium]
ILIQARSGSSRLPGKIYEELPQHTGAALLMHVVTRMRRVTGADVTALVVPEHDERIIHWARTNDVMCLTGPEDDVRERYRRAARSLGADIIVRATGDNPCLDPEKAADTITEIKKSGADLCSYNNLPLGMGVETFTAAALQSDEFPADPAHLEHVSIHIKENPHRFKVKRMTCADTLGLNPLPRLTVDTADDLAVVGSVFERLGPDFDLQGVLALFKSNPEIFLPNIGHTQKPIR